MDAGVCIRDADAARDAAGCAQIHAPFAEQSAISFEEHPASEALQHALGFEPVGTFRRVGHKLGRWHDVAWFQFDLDPAADELSPAPDRMSR